MNWKNAKIPNGEESPGQRLKEMEKDAQRKYFQPKIKWSEPVEAYYSRIGKSSNARMSGLNQGGLA